MDRVQRSGLIALSVLLLTAAGAHFVGSRPGSEAKTPPNKAAQDPAAWEGVKLLPPEQRRLYVDAEDFAREPVVNPLTGGDGRSIMSNIPAPPLDPTAQLAADRLSLDDVDELNGRDASKRANDTRRPVKTERWVRAKENDTLIRIAKRELNDGERWREIARLNDIRKPYVVTIGQLLYLPTGPANSNAGSAALAAASGSSGQAQDANLRAATGARTHVVQPGESLMVISKQYYDTTSKWKKILSANGMKSDRDLRAGMKLTIPNLDS